MKNFKKFAAIAALTLTVVSTNVSKAQDDFNKVLSGMDTKSFQSLTDAFSADVNAGLYHSAKIDKKFSLYLGVKGTTTEVIEGPSTLKVTSVPFAVPQLTVGAFNTDVTLRFVPSIGLGKYGSVSTIGISMRHNLTHYIKKAPFDAAIQFAYQTLSVKDSKDNNIIHSSSMDVNLQFSKTLSVFTIYSGIQYQQTGIDFSFKYGSSNINLHTDNQNRISSTFGLTVALGPVTLNGDYSVGRNNSISTGFGFAF